MWDSYYFKFGIGIPSANFATLITEHEDLVGVDDDPQCENLVEYKALQKSFQLSTQNGSCFEVNGGFWDNNRAWTDTEIGQFIDQYCFYNGVLLLNGEAIPNNFQYEKNIGNVRKLRYTIN